MLGGELKLSICLNAILIQGPMCLKEPSSLLFPPESMVRPIFFYIYENKQTKHLLITKINLEIISRKLNNWYLIQLNTKSLLCDRYKTNTTQLRKHSLPFKAKNKITEAEHKG